MATAMITMMLASTVPQQEMNSVVTSTTSSGKLASLDCSILSKKKYILG